MRVAVLDDDASELELVRATVESMGHDCLAFSDGGELLRALRREAFDLLLLDWHLPGVSGFEVLRWARENLRDRVPALFLTNRGTEADVIAGLDAGADDFMAKPIRVGELKARVGALLRRAYATAPSSDPVFGRYTFDLAGARVLVDGMPVVLKQREFELALYLFRHVGRLLPRKQLLDAIWGVDAETESRSLDTHVSRLRTRLGLAPENGYRVVAVYNVGYRLEATAGTAIDPAARDA